jgi:hypothetical protein
MRQTIQTASKAIECDKCGAFQFDVPQLGMVKCRCGNVLGPMESLINFARDEGHTEVNAKLLTVSREA